MKKYINILRATRNDYNKIYNSLQTNDLYLSFLPNVCIRCSDGLKTMQVANSQDEGLNVQMALNSGRIQMNQSYNTEQAATALVSAAM